MLPDEDDAWVGASPEEDAEADEDDDDEAEYGEAK